MDVMSLKRGTLVMCERQCLDPIGANVQKGTLGVVFEETNAYKDKAGPMVRWFSGAMCNVYPGDVEVVRTN